MLSDPGGEDFVPRKRLHRLSWIFVAAGYIRHFIFPLVALLVFGARDDFSLWGLLLVVPLVIGALWQQWIYRYDFGPRGLVIREGLLFRNVRSIDYARIENVDTERNLLHRLLKVAQVRVETSSGGSSEAVIRVLDMEAVREMRQRIFESRPDATPAAATATASGTEELLHLGAAELVRYGLIDNRGMIVVAAVLGLFAQAGMDKVMARWIVPLFDRLPFADFVAIGPLAQAFLVVSAIAALVAGTRVLSIALALVTLHDFRLARRDEDLRVHHGLFTRLALTLRRPRIQVVHQEASVLHRLFGRVALRVDLAGGSSGGNGERDQPVQSKALWLAPLCTPQKAAELIGIALPGVPLDGLDWQPLAPRARWRLFRLASWTWLIVSALPSGWLLGWWGALVVLLPLPALWLNAHLYVKYTDWALDAKFFVFRRGWLTRRVSFLPRNRIQGVQLAESPFDRRYRMASLAVDTAGAGSRRLRIPFLDRDSGNALMRALYRPGT